MGSERDVAGPDPGGPLTSEYTIFLMESFLGSGTFGKVVKCTRINDMKTVAIKMMKIQGLDVEPANEEVAMMRKLKSLESDKCNLVHWYRAFTDGRHIFLEFEHLDKTLYEFMKERRFNPLLLKEIRPIILQLANALSHLKAAGIIHGDIKLENVMLVDHLREPYRVKVIDFGIACEVSAAKVGTKLQTRPYRSPEIILGLPFTEAIDMWSLGCLAATMFLGTHLYPGKNEYDMMRLIVQTQGQPPDSMLSAGWNTYRFFQKNVRSTRSVWKLKSPKQVWGLQSVETRRLKLQSLDDIENIWCVRSHHYVDAFVEMTDKEAFVDLLKGTLQLEATKRTTPQELLQHRFISMQHFDAMRCYSKYARSCSFIMETSLKNSLTNDSRKTVCGSGQRPQLKTANIAQRNSTSQAKGSSMAKPNNTISHPCTNVQAPISGRSGKKRKMDDEDVQPKNRTNVPRSENNRRRGQKKTAGPTTSCCGRRSQTCVASEVKKSLDRGHADNERSHRERRKHRKCIEDGIGSNKHNSTHAFHLQSNESSSMVQQLCTNNTQGPISRRSGKKRKLDDDDAQPKIKTFFLWLGHDKRMGQKSSAGLSTSTCSRRTQGCVTTEVKKKLDHERDCDNN
ncbi:homeodomain-interacting protein kinase 1-like [Solea senegalensis]|uniref:Homeodomain-interacting protein kinase 1-like n=1 Tax=Solea senegalensis TaxID=28829 RepID=A0AAV6SLT5_SOLSE|nr:homeodomain-interacting protein kinase 1-like [Solea senegalensis]